MVSKVREYMVDKPQTLSPDNTLEEAVQLEMRNRIRHIPIVENRRLVGIVTDRDLKRAMPSLLSGIDRGEYERVMKTTKLSQIMTKDPSTVAPDEPLAKAVRMVCEKKFGGVPVVDGGELVGIVTETDMMRAFLEYLEGRS